MTQGQEIKQQTHECGENCPFPHCPRCGAPLEYYHEKIIQNYMLYEASGGYDGVDEYESWDCPGCDYSE